MTAVVSSALAAAPGDPDPGFGFASKVTTGISQYGDDAAAAVAADSNGKIVAAGRSGTSFAVTRYNADGTLDTTFGGGDGIVTTSFGAGLEANATGVAIDPVNNMIAVVGSARPPFNLGGQESGDFAVARYDENGELDTGFGGGDGRVTTDFGGNDAFDVAIQDDGKIVVAGGAGLARYETDGDLDNTFSTDGKLTTDFGVASTMRSVAVQSDGGIVVAGAAGNSDVEDTDFAVARYKSDGDPDNTFSTDGKLLTDLGGNSDDDGHDVAIQGSGEIVVAGGSNGDFALARYEADGDPDATFGGGDGLVAQDLGEQERANGVALMAGGAILAVGGKGSSIEGEQVVGGAFALYRFTSSGTPDATFGGGDGQVNTEFDGTSSAADGVAVLSGGQIVAAGATSPPFASFEIEPGRLQDFVLAGYESDGALDTAGFGGGDGKVDTQIGDGFGDAADAVAVQRDGKIVVAGRSIDEAGPDDPDFAVARYAPNGDPDTSFSGNGVLTDDFGGLNLFDSAHAVAVQGDGKIVVAGSSQTCGEPGCGELAVARYAANGDPDTTFGGGDGKLTTDLGPGLDEGRDIAIQSDGKIVVSGGSDSGGLALARYMPNGVPDNTFNTDGKLTDSFFEPFVAGLGVAIQPDGAILVAGGASVGGFAQFGVARYEPDGDPDVTFGGGDGRVTTDMSGQTDFAQDVAIQPNGAIVAAGSSGRPDTPVADCGGEPGMDVALARYQPDGAPDTTFSTDGKLTTDFGGTVDEGFGLILQPDGALVAGGRSESDFALARYGPNGAPDATFSGDGRATTDFGAGSCDVARDAVLSQGGLLLAGFARDAQDSRFALTRYLADTTAPQTTVSSGPSGTTSDPTPTFAFSSSEPASTFGCRVDSGSFAPCGSPFTTASLADGGHTFQVRATDWAGNTDATPASRSFTVDTTPLTPGPVFPPPDTTVRADLSAKKAQRALKQNGIVVIARCPDESCTARASGFVSVPSAGKATASKRFKLKRARKSLRRGQRAKLKLRFSKKLRKRIRRALRDRGTRKKVNARVTLSVTDPAGNKKTKKFRVKLKR